MRVKGLFFKTMPFVWAKLLIGGIAVLISIALLALFMGLGWLFGEVGLVAAVILWFVVVRLVWFVIMHYFGYRGFAENAVPECRNEL